eukprot:TRINITY_DN90529_c0_g1_i1.p1 TRINITY_DN90529_c0_g1~~TRINITY_DN90529_c0_g1_i1.p1  ORF type:complete len:424 (+),score=107.07 TRINITY_DN90529_c0_g1_i1:114-1385(+)
MAMDFAGTGSRSVAASSSIFDGVHYKKERKFDVSNEGDILQFYRLSAKLGVGAFGSVKKGTKISNGQEVAIKTVQKRIIKDSTSSHRMGSAHMLAVNTGYAKQLDREMNLLRVLNHPNIIRLLDTFEDEERIFLVLEFCEGGEILDVILDQGNFSEHQGRLMVRQLLDAVGYMHEKGIVHRDLKLANCLLMNRGPVDQNILKVIDFGLAIQLSAGESLRAANGTPYFMSPQVVKGMMYDESADLWSCGVIMYILLCGYPPFQGTTPTALMAKVTIGNYCFSEADWTEVSAEAKDLIRGLLKMSPKERLTAKQAKEHGWCSLDNASKFPRQTQPLSANVLTQLNEFRAQWRTRTSQEKEEAMRRRSQKKAQEQQDASMFGMLGFSQLLQGLLKSPLYCCQDGSSNNGSALVRKGSSVEFVEVNE